jgi:RHS repeat-associated protein
MEDGWLSGQVFALDGSALSEVTVTAGEVSARTDGGGRFMLGPLAPGRQVLWVDGTTAAPDYAAFEVGVEVTRASHSALPYPLWMPRVDRAHAVRVTSPTREEVVVSHPDLPGLELRIPAGCTVRDRAGRKVGELSITPVPLERPPFPMPYGAEFPIYFLLQPWGARIEPYGARVIYPNLTRERPGTRVPYYLYDAVRGWQPYGNGTVSEDRARILPDPEVAIPHTTAFSIKPFLNGPPPCGGGDDGDPVSLSTGLFVLQETDLGLADTIPLALRRSYRPELAFRLRPFGSGSTHPYEIFLYPDQSFSQIDLVLPDGARVHYTRTSPGTGSDRAAFEHRGSPTIFFASKIVWSGLGWELSLRDGTTYFFAGLTPLLQWIRDRYGNRVFLARDGGEHGNILTIHSPKGRWIKFTYAGPVSRNVASAEDNRGRVVRYQYDDQLRMTAVTDPAGRVTRYTYDSDNRMTTVNDGGALSLTNEYDGEGRVVKQTLADGAVYRFAYQTDTTGRIVRTDVTDPRGTIRRVTFDANGYVATDTRALGTPDEQKLSYRRDAATNLLLEETDALGRDTSYTYDEYEQITSLTLAAGTPLAARIQLAYEPRYSLLSEVTDPLGHSARIERDELGRITRIIDPLGKALTFSYDVDGRITKITDALNNVIQFGHQPDSYSTVIDPLKRTFRRVYDGAGRTVLASDAAGRASRLQYDVLDQLLRITDDDGKQLRFTWEGTNLTGFTDARGKLALRIAYDAHGRVIQRTDALGKVETLAYDEMSNLVSYVDRTGQPLKIQYDRLNRPVRLAFAGGDTVTCTWDGANRLTEIADASGAIRRTWDALDRLVREETPQGTVTYSWDAGGRRTAMTARGTTLSYTWDEGSQLTRLTDGTHTVKMEYDALGRRQIVRFDGGGSYSYAFDRASRVVKLFHHKGNKLLGSLRYGYDLGGNVQRIQGNLARTLLPDRVATARYDAANRLTRWGSLALTYDDNGRLTSGGAQSYIWDARGRLGSVGAQTRYAYDALDRRVRIARQGASTDYLYDGANVIRAGGASLLVGPGIDDHLVRTEGGPPLYFLPDVLGSTVALMKPDGTPAVAYTYEPFGRASEEPAGGGNSFQYTGREHDDTGLYYLRARYYSPTLHRFISEDPIGFGGGPNLYTYVADNPVTWLDPLGLRGGSPGGVGTNIAGGALMGFGAGWLGALAGANRPSRTGQAKLGRPSGNRFGWDRSFHFDGPHGRVTTPHFNAEFGPLRDLNHAPIPGWLYQLGSTRALTWIGRGTLVGGFGLDAYNVLTAGPAERGAALGGMIGGFGMAELGVLLGGMAVPGIGAVIGGMLGGMLGGWLGNWLGGMLFPCID